MCASENKASDQREDNLRAQKMDVQGGQQAYASTPYPQDGSPMADKCRVGAPGREPLIYSLRRRANSSQSESGRTMRAIDILERHPEFEELLELIRTVGF